MESESSDTRTPTLQQLIHEERVLSRRRTQLQRRIDSLRAGDGSGDDAAALLAALVEEEREVSRVRRDLHDRIEVARAAARRSRS